MLHALELENFKAFGKRARIPFAPITLIFGENSAGKSTILQALYLLKQTLERGSTGALLLPRIENGIVDLGSFQEMLFDHDLKRTLSIRVEANLNWKTGIEFSFKRPSLEEEVLLDQISIYDGESSKCLAKFQPLNTTEDPEEFWMRMGYAPPIPHDSSVPSKSSTVECVWLTAEPEYWMSEFAWCKENQVEIRKQFKSEKSHLEDQLLHRETNEGKDSVTETIRQLNAWDRKEIDFTSAALEFFSSDFDLKTYISKRCEDEMNTVLNLEGPLPDLCLSERNSFIERSRSVWYTRHNGREVFHIGEYVIDIGEELEQTLKALFPISPFRKPPERWYIFRGTSPSHVGYQGDLLPDLLLRRPELVDETNGWLEKLNIGHQLKVKSMGADSGDLFEVRLIDTRRRESISVALPDVGFGVSQLLPFIVQSLVSEKQIISIEQPEVHVHPKLQADLGDLLAEAIKEPRQNRFIVETHSEHLILRLQRLVRKKVLNPEDISVIYVSRRPEGAKAERLHLDEDGDFIDDWPNGFFTERLREL